MQLIEHDYPLLEHELNCRMPNGTYGGVRGKETKVGQKTSFLDLLDCINSTQYLHGASTAPWVVSFGYRWMRRRCDATSTSPTNTQDYVLHTSKIPT